MIYKYINMETNISQIGTVELKALAYDQMVQLDILQNNLRLINQELMKRAKEQNQSNEPFSLNPLPEGSIQKV